MVFLTKNNIIRIIALFLSVCLFYIAFQLWTASILISFLAVVLLLDRFELNKFQPAWFFLVIIGFLFFQWSYLVRSFNFDFIMLVAEEIPLIGLVYIIHVLHFWKKIPQPFLLYGLLFLGLGILKSKYLFLATPFLLMGLIQKEKSVGLWLESKRFSNKIEIVPVVFVVVFGFGLILSGVSMFPTQIDFVEMQQAIDFATDNNIPLVNEWGSGWYFVYLGFETKYKIGPPDPDWNNLDKPFVAYSRDFDLNCSKISKNTWLC